MKHNLNNGYVLSEAIVAMGLITVGILGLSGLLARSIHEGRYIADKITAVNLAGEGIEIARNILDSNALRPIPRGPWNDGFNTPGFFEVDFRSASLGNLVLPPSPLPDNLRFLRQEQIGEAIFYSYAVGGVPTSFRRSVQIEPGPNQIRATARVFWTARDGRLNEVVITSDFYNWR